MDFALNIIKVISMMLTGLFGMIGTFKDFAADQHATRWKRLTISGIVLTTLLSIAIQNLEYINAQQAKAEADKRVNETAHTLSTITDRTSGITATSDKIQRAQATMLDATTATKEGVEKSLVAQGRLLDSETEAVTSISQLLNPIDPVGFAATISFRLATNQCLRPYVDQIVSYASRHDFSSDGHLVDDPGTVARRDSTGRLMAIELSTDSKALSLLPPNGLPSLWVRFHTPPWKVIDVATYPFAFAYYSIGFTERDDPDQKWTRGAVPELRNHRKMEIVMGTDTGADVVYVEMASLGVRKEGGSARSISDLPGTIMEVEVGLLNPGGCVSPELNDLEMVWGQNYVFDTSFQPSKFQTVKKKDSTSFVYRTTREDWPAVGRKGQ